MSAFQIPHLPQLIHPKYGDAFLAKTPDEVEAAEAMGHLKCHNPRCNMMLSPEAQHRITSGPGFYTCQQRRCGYSYHIHNEWPDYNPSGKSLQEMEREHNELLEKGNGNYHVTGGIRRSGYNPMQVGQIAEDLVYAMKVLPGYGPITWWHEGGATGNSPLDGATKEWGIEVKAIDITSFDHRFKPGAIRSRVGEEDYNEPESKIIAASEQGYKGVLGILAILNFYTSTADVYAKEFPVERKAVGTFGVYSPNSHLIGKDVPFTNNLLDPHSPSPAPIEPIPGSDPMPF